MRLAFEKFLPASFPNKTGDAVVILHGLFGSKSNWKSFALRSAPLIKFPIFTVDARNHGESRHVDEMSIENMCEDLHEFVQEQKIKRVSLLGHSMVSTF